MKMKLVRFTSVLFMLLFAGSAFSQVPRSQAMLQIPFMLNSDATGNGTTDHASRSGGFLLGYSYDVFKWAAVEASYGYARDSQNYMPTGNPTSSVQATLNQFSILFVYRLPVHISKVRPYALAGSGVAQFRPTSAATNPANTAVENRGTLVYGVGADVEVKQHIGIRLDYRGMFYTAPDFGLSSLTVNAKTHLAEPSVGVFYRF